MAVGRPIRVPDTGSMAGLYSQIAQSILSAGEATGRGYAALGAGIGGGMAQVGQNRRERKVRADAKAERESERAEARAERESLRAERKAERESDKAENLSRWQAEFGLRKQEVAFKEQAATAAAELGRLREAQKAAAKAEEEAAGQLRNSLISGGAPDPSAMAPVEQAQGVIGQLMGRLRGMAQPPQVLREDGMGGVVDETDVEALYEQEKRRYSLLTEQFKEAKKPKDVFMLRAAMMQTERRLTGLKSAVEAKGEQKAAATALRGEIDTRRKAAAGVRGATGAMLAESGRPGGPDSRALLDRFRGDFAGGMPPKPSEVRREAEEMTKPTPGAAKVATDEQEHAARLARPESRRAQEFEAEFDEEEAKIRAAYRTLIAKGEADESDIDAELRALAARLAAKYGIKPKAQPITGF